MIEYGALAALRSRGTLRAAAPLGKTQTVAVGPKVRRRFQRTGGRLPENGPHGLGEFDLLRLGDISQGYSQCLAGGAKFFMLSGSFDLCCMLIGGRFSFLLTLQAFLS